MAGQLTQGGALSLLLFLTPAVTPTWYAGEFWELSSIPSRESRTVTPRHRRGKNETTRSREKLLDGNKDDQRLKRATNQVPWGTPARGTPAIRATLTKVKEWDRVTFEAMFPIFFFSVVIFTSWQHGVFRFGCVFGCFVICLAFYARGWT